MAAAPALHRPEIFKECSRVFHLEDFGGPSGAVNPDRGRTLCSLLEIGNILLLKTTPFAIPAEDQEFLLRQKQVSSPYHKNIAYRPGDRITGIEGREQSEAQEFWRTLRNYSQQAVEFVNTVLTPYAGRWKLDYASFRPIEERGRQARLHARNDLLHFDSFPTRPTNGSRILRFFTNINPAQDRVWLTSLTFEAFGPRFARAVGLDQAYKRMSFVRGWRSAARYFHIPWANRPPYDEFMHRCHNAMKEDANFQETTPKHRWAFPPNCSWLAFTDCVSHAVVEGQYALEQTFIIPQSALVESARSPLVILENIAGHKLTI